jgi:hypothetical protein
VRRALVPLSAFALLAALAAPARAQSCWASGDTSVISVSAGGVQSIGVRTAGVPLLSGYRVLGSFSGTSPGTPFFNSYVPLNVDSYFKHIYSVGSRLVPGGHLGLLDGNGDAIVRIVVPAGAYPHLAGRTVHHAIVPLHTFLQQPYCSTPAVALTFVP